VGAGLPAIGLRSSPGNINPITTLLTSVNPATLESSRITLIYWSSQAGSSLQVLSIAPPAL
jgi:hypothetical protein